MRKVEVFLMPPPSLFPPLSPSLYLSAANDFALISKLLSNIISLFHLNSSTLPSPISVVTLLDSVFVLLPELFVIIKCKKLAGINFFL